MSLPSDNPGGQSLQAGSQGPNLMPMMQFPPIAGQTPHPPMAQSSYPGGQQFPENWGYPTTGGNPPASGFVNSQQPRGFASGFDPHSSTTTLGDRQAQPANSGWRNVPGVGQVPPQAPKYSQPWISGLIDDEEHESNFLRRFPVRVSTVQNRQRSVKVDIHPETAEEDTSRCDEIPRRYIETNNQRRLRPFPR